MITAVTKVFVIDPVTKAVFRVTGSSRPRSAKPSTPLQRLPSGKMISALMPGICRRSTWPARIWSSCARSASAMGPGGRVATGVPVGVAGVGLASDGIGSRLLLGGATALGLARALAGGLAGGLESIEVGVGDCAEQAATSAASSHMNVREWLESISSEVRERRAITVHSDEDVH
jgi:hypothetical protein